MCYNSKQLILNTEMNNRYVDGVKPASRSGRRSIQVADADEHSVRVNNRSKAKPAVKRTKITVNVEDQPASKPVNSRRTPQASRRTMGSDIKSARRSTTVSTRRKIARPVPLIPVDKPAGATEISKQSAKTIAEPVDKPTTAALSRREQIKREALEDVDRLQLIDDVRPMPKRDTAKVAETKSTQVDEVDDQLTDDIDREIDELIGADKKSKSDKKQGKKLGKKKWSKKKKIIVGITISLFVVLIVYILVLLFLPLFTLTKNGAVKGSPLDIFNPAELQADDRGRTNVLLFGTSEDDEGHSGALLADSIIMLSINQSNSDVAMFSVPRDFWVEYGGICSVGYSGKVNAGYMCKLEANNNDTDKAGQAYAQLVGDIFNMKTPYYVKVDYTVITSLVDKLGGIDVKIHSTDPRGIYDVRTGLKLPAGVNHLNGEQALTLARARNSKGGYGLSRSNFDREKNQQRIIQAVQQKMLNAGVLADAGKVNSIVESFGDNMRTNISVRELSRLIQVALGMQGGEGVRDIDISEYVKTGRIGGASVVIPRAGQGQYDELRSYLTTQIYDHQKPESNANTEGQK